MYAFALIVNYFSLKFIKINFFLFFFSKKNSRLQQHCKQSYYRYTQIWQFYLFKYLIFTYTSCMFAKQCYGNMHIEHTQINLLIHSTIHLLIYIIVYLVFHFDLSYLFILIFFSQIYSNNTKLLYIKRSQTKRSPRKLEGYFQ